MLGEPLVVLRGLVSGVGLCLGVARGLAPYSRACKEGYGIGVRNNVRVARAVSLHLVV